MRRLYIARHGEPDFPGGVWRCIGSGTDLPLSERGRCQAERLARLFDGLDVSSLWSSPMLRARETARLMTRGRLEVHVHPDLREAYIGLWENLTPDEVRARFPGEWEARQLDMSVPPTGGEDYGAAGARFESALLEILGRTRGDVAVAAHSSVTCAFLCRVTGRPLRDWPAFAHDYATVACLEFGGGGFELKYFGKSGDEPPKQQ